MTGMEPLEPAPGSANPDVCEFCDCCWEPECRHGCPRPTCRCFVGDQPADRPSGECPDCVCCTRDDCNRRACAGGSCPCTES